MDRLELKSTSDRTLGVGVVEKESSLLVLTAATMMKTEIDLDEVARFHPECVVLVVMISAPLAHVIQNWSCYTDQVDNDKGDPLWFITGRM